MENNISNKPDLYKFLTLCAIEQRGVHTLCDFNKNATIGTKEDINFVNQYVKLALSSCQHDQTSIDFLNNLIMFKNNMMVHLTRDCQIIETGNH